MHLNILIKLNEFYYMVTKGFLSIDLVVRGNVDLVNNDTR